MTGMKQTVRVTASTKTKENSVRKRHWCGGQVVCCGVLLAVFVLAGGHGAAAEPKKFTLINVLLDGSKIWLPSTLIVQQGDDVELTLINKLDEPHGFKIEDFGIEEKVLQPKEQTTVKFTAAQPGVH